jgi:hypothetical protein
MKRHEIRFVREEAERTGGLAVDAADTDRMISLRNLPNGMVRLEATLQLDEADLAMKAIDKARDELRALSLGAAQSPDPAARAGSRAGSKKGARVRVAATATATATATAKMCRRDRAWPRTMSRERLTGTALPRKRQRPECRQASHRRVAPRWSEGRCGVEGGL